MKQLIFFILLLALTGCATKDKKAYTNKIKFFQPKPQKVLYAEIEKKPVAAEFYKINFKDTLIAENWLNSRIIERITEHEKSFIPVVYKELETIKRFTDTFKAEMAEREKQNKQIKEMKKEQKEINARIEKLKLGETNGY